MAPYDVACNIRQALTATAGSSVTPNQGLTLVLISAQHEQLLTLKYTLNKPY
jgi:hypothetical protein